MIQPRFAIDPLRPALQLSVCRNLESAYEHLCDHVLTRPEAHFWAHLIRHYRDYLDSKDGDELLVYARRLWEESFSGGTVSGEQELFNGYVEAIRVALA